MEEAGVADPALFSTRSLCMMAMCAAVPPKLIHPSLNQNRNASLKEDSPDPAEHWARLDTLFARSMTELWMLPGWSTI
jgi:hypothetical protein